MNKNNFYKLIQSTKTKNPAFLSFNFGCRVNAAETNQLSQILINHGFKYLPSPASHFPSLIIVNTCATTQKGEKESLQKIRSLKKQFPKSKIMVTGCADTKKIKHIYTFNNKTKEKILNNPICPYTTKIPTTLTKDKKYLLRIQSGCTSFCSYCVVPYRRSYLWHLPIKQAIKQTNQAIKNGFTQIIITGINLNLYKPDLSNLVETMLKKTSVPLISFGSIPINCIDSKFISLISKFSPRISNFLHIPIQSGSNKILKLMNRPYTRKKIINTFNKLKSIKNLTFGTDIIVGFPGETQKNFLQSYRLCKQINFNKIHTFRYSPRPNTLAEKYYQKYPKLSSQTLKNRSFLIRSLIKR
ncbi:radical SAM protein [Patescibacteria group bacterium]|nr:radical SAM protein [Patescibacteria group bacterium]